MKFTERLTVVPSNSFSTSTGKFTVPSDATYMCILTVTNDADSTPSSFQLMATFTGGRTFTNGQTSGGLCTATVQHGGSTTHYKSASCSRVVGLKIGDTVYVKSNSSGDVHGNCYLTCTQI